MSIADTSTYYRATLFSCFFIFSLLPVCDLICWFLTTFLTCTEESSYSILSFEALPTYFIMWNQKSCSTQLHYWILAIVFPVLVLDLYYSTFFGFSGAHLTALVKNFIKQIRHNKVFQGWNHLFPMQKSE